MDPLSGPELKQLCEEVNRIVIKHAKGSAFRGLLAAASGFFVLCDVYAKPNAENQQGMVDNPQDLRDIIASVIKTGSLEKL